MTATIRLAAAGDAPAIAAIYRPYVTDTVVTFEEAPPDAAEMARRIATTGDWLVLEADGTIAGYAYAHPFHARAAYRWTCETTIYLDRDRRRRGAGRLLYAALFDRLAARGLATAIALVTLPNDESARFHEAMGFRRVGLLEGVGWKDGAWRDVGYFQRDLCARNVPPPGTGPTISG